MADMPKNSAKNPLYLPDMPVHVGEQKMEEVKITVIDYDKDLESKQIIQHVDECFQYRNTATVTWINVDGLHDNVLIDRLGQHYGLHPLVIEDVLNTHQRSKIDLYDEYLLVVLKMHTYSADAQGVDVEQVSIVLTHNAVLTFQEKEGDVFHAVRERIKHGKGRIRKAGADYLAYALMDAIVDSYFEILERFDEQIDILDDELLDEPRSDILQRIHFLKRELIVFRKSLWPLRNMLSELDRQDTALIQDSTKIYLRDLHDHTIQVIDTIEGFRDMVTGILDVYLSSVSNKMNEIMKFLTIIGTIFIPLTFIAGIYGMNFRVMPELAWKWGYFVVIFVMGIIGGGLLLYFKKRKWL